MSKTDLTTMVPIGSSSCDESAGTTTRSSVSAGISAAVVASDL